MAGSDFDLAPQEWATLRGLLDVALDLPAAERDGWVEQLDARFAGLKPRLRALLTHAGSPVVESLLDTLPKVETDQFAPPPKGRSEGDELSSQARIGPYRLLRQIGDGGMASVWLAERTDMLQSRQVALKLPHGAWRRIGLAERMAHEREILATLEHPNIARLYDAGIAADGQPYLAIEYVIGEPLDKYCARNALGVEPRLRLFLQVLGAVAHAHTHLVVHRDLKPSNILVDANGQAKLLDFGIAKLLDQSDALQTPLTEQAGRALTPDYASPEQIAGRPIGTGSDIYSLGVVLYELLSGQRPYRLKRGSAADFEAAVLHSDPPRPSIVAAPTLRRQLQGDLDTIVMKALRKEPAKRYGSVDALADDIRRLLGHHPVLARPDSKWYRASRFVRRNRWGVGAVATIAMAVLSGTAISVWQTKVAREAQARAEEVRGFLTEILQGGDIYRGDGERVSAADLLEQARLKIDRSLAGRPDLKLEMQTLVGLGINNLHEPKVAEALMKRAVAEGTAALGPMHDLVLRARETHALTLRYAGDLDALRKELDGLIPALRVHEQANAAALVRALESQNYLSNSDGKPDEAERWAREMLAVASNRLGMNHPLTLDAQWALIASLGLQNKVDEALALARVAYPATLARYNGNTRAPVVIEAGEKYARVLARSGDVQGGMRLLAQVVDDAGAVFGPDSLAVGFFASNLAKIQTEAGEIKAGLVSVQKSLNALKKAPGAASPPYAISRDRRVALLLAARRPQEAASESSNSVSHWIRLRGPTSAAALAARLDRVCALAQSGDQRNAWRELKMLPAGKSDQPDTWTLDRWAIEGRLQRAAGDAHAALRLHERAFGAATTNAGDRVRRINLLWELGLDHEALHEHSAAIAMLEQAQSQAAAIWPTTTPVQAEIWLAQGRAHLESGQAVAARPLLVRADAFWRAFDADNRLAGEASFWLARGEEAMNHLPQSREAYTRAAANLARSPVPSDTALVMAARTALAHPPH
jgi:serine/threonine-protein kinase